MLSSWRFLQVMGTLLYYQLDALIWRKWAPSRWLLGWWRFGKRRQIFLLTEGERLALALEQLGPIFIKLGQLLSTRYDLLPVYPRCFIRLQDQVKPVKARKIRAALESAWGQPIEAVCQAFDDQPLAAASIAQVHQAILKVDNQPVVIKCVRPGIAQKIQRDLGLLRRLFAVVAWFLPAAYQQRINLVFKELQQTLLHELDLVREGGNATTLQRNFESHPLLEVPTIHWPLTRPSVLVMSRVNGIPVDDLVALKAAGVDLPELARRGVEMLFTQIFRDAFFHADIHPGNLWVDVSQPQDPSFVALDFGIVGVLAHAISITSRPICWHFLIEITVKWLFYM